MSDLDLRSPARPSVALAELVASMSRAFVDFARITCLSNAGLGLSEFIVLVELEGADRLTNAKLAKRIGVSAQRANQVVSELIKMGFAETFADVEDSRQRFIQLTSLGRVRIVAVMDELDALVRAESADCKGLRPTSKRISRIARALRKPKIPEHQSSTLDRTSNLNVFGQLSHAATGIDVRIPAFLSEQGRE